MAWLLGLVGTLREIDPLGFGHAEVCHESKHNDTMIMPFLKDAQGMISKYDSIENVRLL